MAKKIVVKSKNVREIINIAVHAVTLIIPLIVNTVIDGVDVVVHAGKKKPRSRPIKQKTESV